MSACYRPSAAVKAGRVADVPRLALTREEAAASLGVSLTFFAEKIQPELRIVRRGNVRLIPIRELEKWLARSCSATEAA